MGLLLRNGKKFMPTYALWFEFAATAARRAASPARPESTITAKGIDVWAALKKAEESGRSGTVHLRAAPRPRRDAPGSTGPSRPRGAGVLRIELRGVGSLFPFGFLRKLTGTDLRREIPVWPAPVEYRRFAGRRPAAPGGELRQAQRRQRGRDDRAPPVRARATPTA